MQLGFNPSQYQPYTGIELLDAGDYPVVIEDVVAERAKDPASGLLKVTFIVAPGHKNAGRKLFYRLNLWNVSEESKATAHKQLTSLCYAVGITGVLNDTDELKGRQCIINVSNDGTYNNVKLVKDMNGNEPGKAPTQQVQPGSAGVPQFGQPAPGQFNPGAPPPGAMPGGYNPGVPPFGQNQGHVQHQQPVPAQFPQFTTQQPQQPQQPTQPQFAAPAQNPFGAAPVAQPIQQQYQPQAQPPTNPGAQFQPAGHQQQPQGWPQQ